MLLCLRGWGPKELAKSKSFSTSLKKVRPIKMIIRKPLNQEGKKRRTKLPKTQCLLIPCVLQHKHWPIALKNQCTKKNKEEAAEYAKHLDKRMKDAEEKCQEQIVKIHRKCFAKSIQVLFVLLHLLVCRD